MEFEHLDRLEQIKTEVAKVDLAKKMDDIHQQFDTKIKLDQGVYMETEELSDNIKNAFQRLNTTIDNRQVYKIEIDTPNPDYVFPGCKNLRTIEIADMLNQSEISSLKESLPTASYMVAYQYALVEYNAASNIDNASGDIEQKLRDNLTDYYTSSEMLQQIADECDVDPEQAREIAVNAVDLTLKTGKAILYLNACFTLGEAKVAENAIKDVYGIYEKIIGHPEKAAEIVTSSKADEIREEMDSTIIESEILKTAGEVSQECGTIATELALTAMAASTAEVSIPATAVITAVLALDAGGSTLDTMVSQSGEFTNKELVASLAVSGVTVATVGFSKKLTELLKGAKFLKAAKTETAESVKIAENAMKETATTEIKEVAEATAKETVEIESKNVVKESGEEIVKETSEKNDKLVHRFIECRNQCLEGDRHPHTGVEFVRKTVDNGKGELVEGVFPKFEFKFEAKLSPDLYTESNRIQFKEANSQLMKEIEKNPELKKQFSSEQIEQIIDGLKSGTAPDGYVWHHNEEAGVLQLVDFEIHSNTGHTGGKCIWG